MSSKRKSWIERFSRIASTLTNDGWHYTRLDPDECQSLFKKMGCDYKIEARKMVSEERHGKGVKRKVHPGCIYRKVE